jgi:glycogen debranching enzyme
VEIQALWYNALQVCAHLAKRFKENSGQYARVASRCKRSFNFKFWNSNQGYLYDVINGRSKDASIRPNALLAISLPFPILDKEKRKPVVDMAERELLTPYGLRTLSPRDSSYRSSAHGSQRDRDLSYHQGDVWPWLLGPFVDAYKKAYPHRKVGHFIKPTIEDQVGLAGMGCISEVFDGNAPYAPEGCIHQAWSVAEILRIFAGSHMI